MEDSVSTLSSSSTLPPTTLARDTYTHSHLHDSDSIRIFTLHPGQGSDLLQGTLTAESLAQATSASYEAISYVWGSDARTCELHICAADNNSNHELGSDPGTIASGGGGPAAGILPVTQSIYDGLIRLRHPDRPRRLWADQICINQSDVSERSHQVRLMNAIYKGAHHITVWLGHDRHGLAPEAVGTIRRLTTIFSDETSRREFRRQNSEELHRQSQDPWVPLSALTKQVWFSRLWIVQEIGTSTPATLYWGDASIDWEELSHVAGILNTDYHSLRSRFQIFTPNIRYLYQRFVEPPDLEDIGTQNVLGGSSIDPISANPSRGNFIYELHRARHLETKDPHDHVYAFLGHYSIKNGGPSLGVLVPDYSRPLEDVYTDVAVRALRDASDLLPLSAVHHIRSQNRKSRLPRRDQTGTPTANAESRPEANLPSWVPDWRVLPLHLLGTPSTPHRATGSTTPRLEIDEQSRVLHILGRRIDTVARHSWTIYGQAFNTGSSRRRTRQYQKQQQQAQQPSPAVNSDLPFETLWRHTCGLGDFTLDEPYRPGRGDSAFYALAQTLTNGCTLSDRTRPYEEIPKEEWLANAAAYLLRERRARPPRKRSYTSSIGEDAGDIKSYEPRSEVTISPEIERLAEKGDAFKWSHEATLVTRYRKFAVTRKGYYLIGPDILEEGDVLVFLYGGKTPFLLRPPAEGHELEGRGGWTLVGECYVHGLMNGEAMDGESVDSDRGDEVFSIR